MSLSLTLTNRQVSRLRKLLTNARPAESEDSVVLTADEYRLLRELFEDLEDATSVDRTESVNNPHGEDQGAVLERIRRRACEHSLPPGAPDTLTLLREDRAR